MIQLTSKIFRRTAALAAAAALGLSVTAGALFGTKKTEQAPEEAPVAQELKIFTYRGIPYKAQFLSQGGQGGTLTYAVDQAPRKGTVTVDGDQFTYTPDDGITGSDSFTYTVSDGEGNQSLPATVSVTIEKPRSGVAYADTAGYDAAAAAQYLAETGVFVGARVGDQYYFEPDRTVNRGEFLAMTLEAAGREVSPVTMTGFCDDAAIPTWAKAYASAAVSDGVVKGSVTDEGVALRAEEPITVNEAAAMLDRVLTLEDVDLAAWYPGREAQSAWCAQAVDNLESAAVLSAGSFGSAVMDAPLTRAGAAQMLAAASALMENQEPGIFDWLG